MKTFNLHSQIQNNSWQINGQNSVRLANREMPTYAPKFIGFEASDIWLSAS